MTEERHLIYFSLFVFTAKRRKRRVVERDERPENEVEFAGEAAQRVGGRREDAEREEEPVGRSVQEGCKNRRTRKVSFL